MYTGGLYGWVRISTDKNGAKPAAKHPTVCRLRGVRFVYGAFLKGETSGFPSQTHPFPESLCVTPNWRVLPLIIAPAFVLRCNTGSITSGTLTSHLAYCSTSVHPRDFCRFGFCSYRAKVHSHAVLRARTLAGKSIRTRSNCDWLALSANKRLQTAGVRGKAPVKFFALSYGQSRALLSSCRSVTYIVCALAYSLQNATLPHNTSQKCAVYPPADQGERKPPRHFAFFVLLSFT